MQFILKPLIAILAFTFGLLVVLNWPPATMPGSDTKVKTEPDVAYVSVCDLASRPALFDKQTVRVSARSSESKVHLNDPRGGCAPVGFECDGSRKCRLLFNAEDGPRAWDVIVTGTFYAADAPESKFTGPVIKIDDINWVSDPSPNGRGTGTGQGSGRGTGTGDASDNRSR